MIAILFLMLIGKVLVVLVWYLYRVAQRFDAAWELGDLGTQPGESDDGGGGGNVKPSTPPRPSGPAQSRRRRREHSQCPSFRGTFTRRPRRYEPSPSTRTRPVRAVD